MRIIGKVSLSFCVRLLTDALLAANVGTLIFLPSVLSYMYDLLAESYLNMEDVSFLLPFLYVCGTLTLAVLVLGHLILRTLEKGQPFDKKNPVYFRLLAIVSLMLSAAFFIKVALYGTILTIFCADLFLIFALLSLIMSEIFRQASVIWEEHQLTI